MPRGSVVRLRSMSATPRFRRAADRRVQADVDLVEHRDRALQGRGQGGHVDAVLVVGVRVDCRMFGDTQVFPTKIARGT